MLSIIMLGIAFLDCYSECHYTEYRYAERGVFQIVMPSVIILDIIMLSIAFLDCYKCHYTEYHFAKCHFW